MAKTLASYPTSFRFARVMALLAIALFALSCGGCPQPGGDTGGGDTGGGDTGGGGTGGGDTGGGDTGGGDTGGGDTGGGDTGGGDTGGGDTGGGDTGGGGTGGGSDGGDDVGGGDTVAPTAIALENIVQSGDAVPGQPDGTVFTKFGSPIVDADGRVAFWATHENGNGYGGLYVWEDGTVHLVVDDDPADAGSVPGGSASEYFDVHASASFDPFNEHLVWGSAGRLLFTARIVGGLGRTGLFRWRASDADLIRVADSDMIQSGLGLELDGSVFIAYFANFGVTDDGLVLFRTRYTRIGGGAGASGTAVCTSNGVEVSAIVSAVPDQTEFLEFTHHRMFTTQSPGGMLLFQGQYDGDGNHGIYLKLGSNALARVIDNRPSASFPGLPANARIGMDHAYYNGVAISANDHIAVETAITAGAATDDSVILWDFDAGNWAELQGADGKAATALLSGVSDGGAVLVLADDLPQVADRSAAVNLAAELPADLTGVGLEWGVEFGAINNLGHAVVFYRRDDTHAKGLALWTGDALLVLADASAALPAADVTMITAESRPEDDLPGRSGILNDTDEAVFRVRHADGAEAIYVGRAE